MDEKTIPVKPDVSFVIPSYNSQGTIAATIASIEAQVGPLTREILVIDSSEGDAVRKELSQFARVMVVHNPVRLFPGQARNLGAEIAKGEFLAFIDSDITIQQNWLVRLYSRLISAAGIKAAGAVIHNANPVSWASCVLYWMEFSEFLPGCGSGPRTFLSSSNLLIRRTDFLNSPEFDLSFAMSEDMLLSRFFKGSLFLDDTTSVCHRHRTGWNRVTGHLRNLGFWAGRLRVAGAGRGAFLARTRWLSLLLPLYRTPVVVCRAVRLDPRRRIRALALAPLVFLGSCHWSAGFYRGLRRDG